VRVPVYVDINLHRIAGIGWRVVHHRSLCALLRLPGCFARRWFLNSAVRVFSELVGGDALIERKEVAVANGIGPAMVVPEMVSLLGLQESANMP
jgi:hypothetical protein